MSENHLYLFQSTLVKCTLTTFCITVVMLSFKQSMAQSFDSVQTNPFGLADIGSSTSPEFGDLDNDGDLDLMTGEYFGSFLYFENIGTSSIPVFSSPQTNPFTLSDIGEESQPALVDLDKDGDLDLMAGVQNGKFKYFENTGTLSAPIFSTPVTNPFSLAQIGTYSSPSFADLDNDGDFDMIAGNAGGNFKYFENIGTPSSPLFAAIENNPFGLSDIGTDSKPFLIDLDNDGDFDILAGENMGGFYYFENIGDASSPTFAIAQVNAFNLTNIGSYSNPTLVDLDNDGDLDLMSGKPDGTFKYIENVSIVHSAFDAVQTDPFSLVDLGERSTPFFVDLDNDGDLDVMAGTATGDLKYFENSGTMLSPGYSAPLTNPFSLTNTGVNANISFIDLDDDGDLDLMTGSNGGKFKYYENTGNVSVPSFAAQVINPFSLPDIGTLSSPSFADMDNDNDYDLISGNEDGTFEYFENTGTVSNPVYATPVSNPFGLTDTDDDSIPFLIDVDNDGDFDLLAGDSNGKFHYFENKGTTRIPEFGAVQLNPFGLTNIGINSTVSMGDLDDDGDIDLISGHENGRFKYFENIPDITKPAPDVATLQDLLDPSSITPSVPTATDEVDGTLTGVAYLTFPITTPGITEIIWTYTDAAGNTSYQSQDVLIADAFVWNGETSYGWSTVSNWVGDVAPTGGIGEIIIPAGASNYPIITANKGVTSIHIQSGATVTIFSKRLKVTGDMILDGSIIIESGASLLNEGNVTGAGSATIHRNTTFGANDGQYSVIGSPITAGSTSSLGNIVYRYDETVPYDAEGTAGSARFYRVSSPESMNVGEGYFSANTGNISFMGMPNSGDISIAMVYDEANDGGSATHAGFNLVSNPYTAAIDYDRFVEGNNHIDGTIYLWDDGGSDGNARTNSDYLTVNSIGAASGGSLRAASWDGKIRSTQGFFVKATSANLLNFTPVMMNSGGNSDAGFFRKVAPTVLRFSLSSSEQFNEILIGFTEEATAGFDRSLDAYKVKGNSDLQLYSKLDEADLAIQALPLLSEELVVPLGFDIDEVGQYTLAISDPDLANFSVYLMDHQLNSVIDLADGSYTFESASVANSDRFSLVFSQSVLSVVDKPQSKTLTVFSKKDQLHIRMEQELYNAEVKIYSLQGALIKQLHHVDFAGQDIQTQLNGKGIYIMTVQNKDELLVEKFINR